MNPAFAPERQVIIPGATHLFDEPGTLAAAWFQKYLSC